MSALRDQKPTVRKALAFLKTEGLANTASTIKNLRIADTHDGWLTIGRGTPLTVKVNREPNGHINLLQDETGNDQVLLNEPSPGDRPGTFELLARHIRREAEHQVRAELDAWLGLLPDETQREDQATAAKLRNLPNVTKQIEASAEKAVLQHPDFQGAESPATHAYRLQREFLGTNLTDRITALIGPSATLKHLMLMQAHLSDFEELDQRHANFIYIWGRKAYKPPPATSPHRFSQASHTRLPGSCNPSTIKPTNASSWRYRKPSEKWIPEP